MINRGVPVYYLYTTGTVHADAVKWLPSLARWVDVCYSALVKKEEEAMFAKMKQKKFEDSSKTRKEADKVSHAYVNCDPTQT